PMSSASQSEPKRRRALPGVFVALGLAAAAAVTGALVKSTRAEEAARGRVRAGEELAALERCLIGEPLQAGEALGDRVRGVELAIALESAPPEEDPIEIGLTDPADAGADASAD